MRWVAALALGAGLLGWGAARADTPVTFEGKTITMLIGFESGGGTDSAGRLMTTYLAKYLPGNPTFKTQNMPGADGLTALNYFVGQVKPDGTTVTLGASTQASPARYRKPQSKYDPAKFHLVGGTGRGGTVLLINAAAEKRLHDKSLPPVVMGSLGGMPRSGMLTTAWGMEFLGWNAKWVLGYRGTNDLMIALERGEIDMTATGNMFLINKMIKDGKFKILTQSGQLDGGRLIGRQEFGKAPIFPAMLEGKIVDPLKAQSFKFWSHLTWIDKWVALPPDTPKPIVDAYRAAFDKMSKDPEFIAMSKKISDDFEPQSYSDVQKLMDQVVSTSDAAIGFMETMLRGQGLNVKD